MQPNALVPGSFLLPPALGRDFILAHAQGVEVTIGAEGLAPFRDALDLIRTVHLPFLRAGRLNLAHPDATARESDLDYLKRAVTAVRPVAPAVYVIHPTGLRRWEGCPPGDLDILVRMLRRLADETRTERTGPLAIENNRTYWNGIPDAVSVEEADRSNVNHCFGETPAEWVALAEAVGRDDVRLCLDLSHATTSAHLYPNGPAREACLREFLQPHDRIVHVHWSDNFLYDNRGRADSHAYVGRGALPRWFHRAVRRLDATFMFEVDPDQQAVREMLRFVQGLEHGT